MNCRFHEYSHEGEINEVKSLEREFLIITNHTPVTRYTTNGDNLSVEHTRKDCVAPTPVTMKSAFLIFVSFSCGAAILVLPYTISQLGIPLWFFFVLFILTLLMFCAYLNNESTTLLLLQQRTNNVIARDPYPAIAELAGGKTLRLAVVIAMYTTNIGACISWILLSATVLRDLLPLKSLEYLNQIRVWAVIIVILLTPFMYLGTYSDLKIPAFIAILSSLVSSSSIIVNSILASYETNVTFHHLAATCHQEEDMFRKTTIELVFIAFGSICFVASGASYSIPNITVLSSKPTKLHTPLSASLVFISIVYMGSGITPYMVFRGSCAPSITTTFYCLMENHEMSLLFKILSVTSQVCMPFHFMMVCLLTMNPCYQHIETVINIPPYMGWKRIITRTAIMLFVLIICACVPRFSPVLSVAGGVPGVLVGVIFPILIYLALFPVNVFVKVTLVLLLSVTTLFVIGNFITSVLNLLAKKL